MEGGDKLDTEEELLGEREGDILEGKRGTERFEEGGESSGIGGEGVLANLERLGLELKSQPFRCWLCTRRRTRFGVGLSTEFTVSLSSSSSSSSFRGFSSSLSSSLRKSSNTKSVQLSKYSWNSLREKKKEVR